MGGEDK